jgi:threonine synthase
MRYVSTRGGGDSGFEEALLRGIAPNGGLYAPDHWPALSRESLSAFAAAPYPALVEAVLGLFGSEIGQPAIAAAAGRLQKVFHHAAVAPLVQLEPNLWLLELFHGPTAAFKDLAMQVMAVLLEAALARSGERLLLLVATSGDTGAAAVAAFAGSARVSLVVLHPKGRVSPVQRRQMTTSGAVNVLNLAVEGDFDDCQRMVKALLADEALRACGRVSSVNSINWGRLAGQVPYYLAAAAALGSPGRPVTFAVPTGNLGDAFAGWIARRMGADIGPLVAALNANDSLARLLDEGRYVRRPAVATASVSMDVQAPSNLERLVFEASGRDAGRTAALFSAFARDGVVDAPAGLLQAMRSEIRAVSIDEAECAAEIAHAWTAYGRLVCPHTAVAVAAARRLDRSAGPVVALATAHPAKFPDAIWNATGVEPALPPHLAGLEAREEVVETIAADAAAAGARVRSFGRS